jgi:hypothetical protein
MLNGTINMNPIMFRLLFNWYDRGWVFWICHRADCNADQRGQIAEFPVDCWAAPRTEIVMDFPAACGGVRELFWGSWDGDNISGVISAYTERRAGSALAVDAVTSNDYLGWLFWKRERDSTATASSASHRKMLQLFLSKQSLPRSISTCQIQNWGTTRVQIANLAKRYAVPTVFSFRTQVEAGGLLSYGPNLQERDRQVALYVSRIIKGEKPAEILPVQQMGKFDLVINLRTAKALGLSVPNSMQLLADAVIE